MSADNPKQIHVTGCEDAAHVCHDGTNATLALRLAWLRSNQFSNFVEKVTQLAAYSVNHGAGRCMGRKAADRALDQKTVDDEFVANDILTNCRLYPKDEAPAAYKDFDAVLDSVKSAGLASEVARLKARFVIKDADMSLRGAA